MPSVTKKTFDGRTYYYLRYSARVDGKPKVVKTVYLGRAEDIEAAVEGSRVPTGVKTLEFGAVAAAKSVADAMGITEAIDAVCPKRDQGLSVGTYITLAAINRATNPTSKAGMADFVGQSVLSRIMSVPKESLSSQRFFDAMGYLSEAAIAAAEEAIAKRTIQAFGLDLSTLVFDTTNFATHIDSATASALAKRGHSKTKRHDLRLIGLALAVSRADTVPLVHSAYPGNVPDAKMFPSVLATLAERYRQMAPGTDDITLVFDKGNNSKANIACLDESAYHFVGSLVPSHHADLCAVPLDRFRPASGFDGLSCCRTQKEVFGQVRTVLVTYSEEFAAKQERGLAQTIAKVQAELADASATVSRPAVAARKLTKILEPRWMAEAFVLYSDVATKKLLFHPDEAFLDRLRSSYFGKRILFTDRNDWTDEEIIGAYRSQASVEGAFRQMKDPAFVAFTPMWHWTDQKIRVHAFYCVLALAIVNLIARKARAAGFEGGPAAALECLAQVKEVVLAYKTPGPGRPRIVRTLTDTDPDQGLLLNALDLRTLAP